jgi:hypothetical protein
LPTFLSLFPFSINKIKYFKKNYRFEHSPCFVCGGSCASAHACSEYDSNRERLQEKYGPLIRAQHRLRRGRGQGQGGRDRDRRR